MFHTNLRRLWLALTLTQEDWTLLYEGCDVQRESHADTLQHQQGEFSPEELAGLAQERDAYQRLQDAILPLIR